jgi:prepilin-type N-terminal cleavage/methylation domain-containing protein/prepilin-type processing-associated H-X9-DG protein
MKTQQVTPSAFAGADRPPVELTSLVGRRVYLSRGQVRHAFTLTELLVVIAIIGVLAAIIMAAIGGVVRNAHASKCIANLRQIAAGSLLYSAEHQGKLVPISEGTTGSDAVTFRVLLKPYIADSWEVYVCPADTWAKNQTISAYAMQHGTTPTSYGINGTWYSSSNGTTVNFPSFHDYLGQGSVRGRRQSAVVRPGSTIFLCDIGRPDSVAGAFSTWSEDLRALTNASYGYAKFPGGGSPWTAGDFCIYPRHSSGRANVAFYDGHVETVDITKDIVAHPLNDPKCLYDYH